ncbi:galactitol-1-phosphate 5-dehydrogenase [Haloferula chungangensis]|uniref:Galactitol-1-phosphate 5-dehydrogenase n=1 Tax=Haloferula chungangensis TaxID=1048331 RepID=A0ABW2L2G8_9BACT
MKALQLIGPSTFSYCDLERPVIGKDEVLVKVAACGICGSDIHGMDGSSGRRIPPLVMGHEGSGTIVEVGAGLEGWIEGDRVTFDSTVFCGECGYCQKGQINLCDARQVLGVSCQEFRRDGAFAEFVAVPARVLHRLPDGITFEEAAFAEPVGVALHAVNRVAPEKGDSAVVIGAGLIGLLVVQSLKRAGCAEVYAVDRDAGRLKLAEELGASAGWLADDEVAEKILAATEGKGVDIAMEVVGASPTVNLAVKSVRKGGKVGLVGNLAPEVTFPLQAAVTRELSIFGSCAIAGEYPEALDAIAKGEINVASLTSAVVPLKEGADWFARLASGKEPLLKVLLKP